MGPRIVTQPLQHLKAADTRQADVEQDNGGKVDSFTTGKLPLPEQVIEGLLSVAYHIHLIGQIDLAQRTQDQFFILRIVFHQQYGFVDIHWFSPVAVQ